MCGEGVCVCVCVCVIDSLHSHHFLSTHSINDNLLVSQHSPTHPLSPQLVGVSTNPFVPVLLITGCSAAREQ